EFGVHRPVHLVYSGDPYLANGATLKASPGIGDLRFVPKVALVRSGSLERHVLLSLAMPIGFPTGNSAAFRGAGGFSIQPELLFEVHLGRLGLLFDAGYRYRSKHPVGLAWGDEITFGGGIVYGLTDTLALRIEA